AAKASPGARDLWVMAEMIDVIGSWVQPETMRVARSYLLDGIARGEEANDPRGDRGISRSVEGMAQILSTQERHKAAAYLVLRLGKQDDGPQLAVPRALNTLVRLHPDEVAAVSPELGKAIIAAAARRSRNDSAYLVAMMQIAETAGERLAAP